MRIEEPPRGRPDPDPPVAPEPGVAPSVLGSDPFAETGPDPLTDWLDALERVAARAARAPEASRGNGRPLAEVPPEPPPRRGVPLTEVELPAEARGLERLIGEEPRRRLAALLAGLGEAESYDRFGLSPAALRRAFPAIYALYRFYFRVRSTGHERLPVDGPAVLATNHAGLLPFDGAMTVLDVLLHTDPPRLPRAIVDRWAGSLPFVNVFFARVGQVVGTRENFTALLEDGELVLVFPEGMEGIRKTITQRYRLQRFHVGFVEQALRARAPIVPVAVIGSDDQTPILYDVKPLARRLGLPVAPITPTFPWLGPLGLLPYPVGYQIVYGEPLRFHERFDPDAAEDAPLVRALASQVRRAVQLLIDRNR